MTRFLARSTRFLHEPVGAGPRVMLALAAVLVVLAYFTPLWRLTMFAPQYEHGLQLDIHTYTLEGGHGGQDVKEINILNHYIGMRDLVAEDFTEFKWLPFVVGALALLYLRAAAVGVKLDRTATILTVTLLPWRETPALLRSHTASGCVFSAFGYTSIGLSLSVLMICA